MIKRLLLLSLFTLFLASCASTASIKLPSEIDVTDASFDIDVYVPKGILLNPNQLWRASSYGAVTLDIKDWEQLNLDIRKSQENLEKVKKRISDYNKLLRELKR